MEARKFGGFASRPPERLLARDLRLLPGVQTGRQTIQGGGSKWPFVPVAPEQRRVKGDERIEEVVLLGRCQTGVENQPYGEGHADEWAF